MKATVNVYLRNAGGAKFSYDIEEPTKEALTVKAREHIGQIQMGGYRHCDGTILEWFPPHWIDKVKVVGEILTSYPDRMSGT